ncbi:MAG: hypothetical protein WD491_08340 [Balneolales bacterium]
MRKGQPHLLFSLALFSLLIAVSSCEDSGIVGSDLVDEPPSINSDTVDIPLTEGIPITAFSGNENYFSAGWYNDNSFGEQQITGMVNPSLSRQGINDIEVDAKGYLKLHIEEVYGDQNATASFDLVEIGRRWRAPAWRHDSIPELTNNVVASFDITDQDSLEIPLSDEWFGRYVESFNTTAARDSLYRQEMFGLALVPKNQAKIISFGSGNTELIIDNQETSEDDDENGEDDEEPGIYTQFMRATAYSVNREFIPPQGQNTALYNTFENTLRLSFDATEEFIGSKNVSRAELVLYEDTLALQNLPAGHTRPEAKALYVYLLDENETERAVLKDPSYEMLREEEDNSFRLNLTSYINSNLAGTMDERDLYVIVRSNDGRIIPTFIQNETSEDRKPRIIITSVNPEK